MRISDVLRTKGSEVATVKADASVTDLLNGLAEHNIGAMVVLAEDGVAGIVSERDVVRAQPLDVPVPDEPFPSTNTTAEFQALAAAHDEQADTPPA